VGTSCYVLGGAELLSDVETAIDSGRMEATLSGSTCMGHCNRVGASRVAPCATVDGVLIERASEESILRVISDRVVEEERTR
jgi:NADH:ubiquinone oxidoreductase subunit E